MFLVNSFLALCHEAKQKGLPLNRDPGACIGRGFADLGFEVFLCCPQGVLVSLLTGERSVLRDSETDFFFSVPTVDELCLALESEKIELVTTERQDQREWYIELATPSGRKAMATDTELLNALLKGYLAL
ncbi:MAG: hypothetical protein KDD60_08685 [Bdellovibrionales bacterium]|nr:hypothetical protein [Bdellovibrionales bacterium]